MPAFSATAPGKIILFGEHAVVYGRPAIAAPVTGVGTRVTVNADLGAPPGQVRIQSPQVGLDSELSKLPAGHPLAETVRILLEHLEIPYIPACTIRIQSSIPVASGMGSGAAVSVALLRSLSAFLGRLLSDEGVSALAFEIEKIHHGTPSGIDNSVVSYRRPVYFVKGQALQFLHLPRDFSLLVADTGVPSPTALSVGDVRGGWQAEPERYEAIFDHIGTIVEQARERLESGQTEALGELMDQNQAALRELDVSSPKLERLIAAARQNEALGAKLCGGGRGGNLIALPAPGAEARITQALQDAGATRVILTTVSSKG